MFSYHRVFDIIFSNKLVQSSLLIEQIIGLSSFLHKHFCIAICIVAINFIIVSVCTELKITAYWNVYYQEVC